MRLRHFLLATAVTAGSAAAVAAQDPNPEVRTGRRTWTWVEPKVRIRVADPYRFRMTPDRRIMVERALDRAERTRSAALDRARTQVERAARLRDRASDRSFERLDRVRDREFAMRDRLSDRLRTNLRRNQEIRERSMERVRERMDRLRDEHRFMIRRRSRTI